MRKRFVCKIIHCIVLVYCTSWMAARVGNLLIGFVKNEWFAQKTERFAHFLWATWAISSPRSFLVSDLSDSFTPLIKKEGLSKSLAFFKTYKKMSKKRTKKYDFSQNIWANGSFFVSERANERFAKKNERFAHSLIYQERIAHSRSFLMRDLSDSLTVAHLSWANNSQLLIWSERSERISEWAMSEGANSQPWWRPNKNNFCGALKEKN